MEPNKEINIRLSIPTSLSRINWRGWLPSRGNVVFTLVVVFSLFWAQSANALPWAKPAAVAASTGIWPYQGRLANSAGTPVTAAVPMTFRLYNAASGGTPLWEEQWTSVQITGGLFNVMLGSLTAIPQSIVSGNNSLWLGIAVGTDSEMTPRVQLGSAPFAWTVPDGSITTPKLADANITTVKIANGAITQAKLAAGISTVPLDGSVTTVKLADNAVNSAKIVDGSVTRSDLASGTASKITFLSAPVTLLDRWGANIDDQVISVSPYIPATAKIVILGLGTGSTEQASIWIYGPISQRYMTCSGETWHWGTCQGMVPLYPDQTIHWGASAANGAAASQGIVLVGYVE
jgi:hypothetical protein